jgi:thiopurine S-methyltransferase
MKWSGPVLGWHKGDVNPHLQKYSHLLLGSDDDEHIASRSVFVPLAGKSVDLAYLASHPKISHVVGIDIIRSAVIEFSHEHPEFFIEEVILSNECETTGDDATEITCERSAEDAIFRGRNITFLIKNIFDLLPMTTDDRAKLISNGTSTLFDSIYDRASIVAIEPSLREDYITLMGELLKPGGTILLVTLDRRYTATDEAKSDGPPFSIDERETRQLFETQSWVESVMLLDEVNELTTDEERERWRGKGVLDLFEMVFLIKKINLATM